MTYDAGTAATRSPNDILQPGTQGSRASGTVLSRLDQVTGSGPQRRARCPAHDDRHASLSVHVNATHVALTCHAGCDVADIVAALGLTMRDLFFTSASPDAWMPCGHDKIAEYLYRDEAGTLLYGVARCLRKCFRQWRPDPLKPYGKTWNLNGVRRVPYRLPEVIWRLRNTELAVWIVEGEKDANRLWSRNIPATCNSGGAEKWTAEHAAHLAGADIVIVADRDVAGRKHAEMVVATLLPLARSIEVVVTATGKDISDHLDAGLGIHELIQVWEPLPAPTGVEGCPDCTEGATT